MFVLGIAFVIVSFVLLILNVVQDISRLLVGLRDIDPGLEGWI